MFFLWWILIQIIGESLPISSSGHVQLLQKYFDVTFQNFENINFLLHGPTIFLLLFCFFTTWWHLIFKNKFLVNFFKASIFIIISDVITFLFWILNISNVSFIQHYFLPIGFCITAICLYFSRYGKYNKIVSWSVSDAIFLGMVQGICLLPGISRFAGTYAAGLWLGYTRKDAISISFLIQFPLLCAAFLKGMLHICKHVDFVQNISHNFSLNLIFLTMLIASLISYALLCWVIRLIEQNRLWYFAFYMIIPIGLSFLMVKDVML